MIQTNYTLKHFFFKLFSINLQHKAYTLSIIYLKQVLNGMIVDKGEKGKIWLMMISKVVQQS